MVSQKVKEIVEVLGTQGTYRNSKEINVGGVPYDMRDVLITAPLIAGLNMYLVGGTGEGKTQLANDLAGFFGDSYCYAEGRPDFELSEILKQLNLGRLRDVTSDRDLVELTDNVRKALFYVDELNRCPPIVQNYFFNFFDGKLVHNGKILRLGHNGYSVGFASGNLGDGAYVGIEDSDRALKDRMHMIVKLDDLDYSTTPEDDWTIFGGKKDPRATNPQEGKSMLDDILAVHQEFKGRDVPVVLQALGLYLHKGLDYLENTRRHSKRAVDHIWPNVQGIRNDTDESKIMPLSKRSVLATVGLTQALDMIAEAKGYDVNNHANLFLDALRFTVPYSGVLSPQFVHNEKDGDAYAAFDDVMEGIKADVQSKNDDLETAIAFAQFGELDGVDENGNSILDKISPVGAGRWSSVRTAIESLAQNPSLDKSELEGIRENYKS